MNYLSIVPHTFSDGWEGFAIVSGTKVFGTYMFKCQAQRIIDECKA